MDNEDQEFILDMMEIEHIFENLNKHDQIRVEKWCKNLCIKIINTQYKKNRNNIAKLLLVSCRNGKLIEVFKKSPPEGPIPIFEKNLFQGLKKEFLSKTRPNEVIKRFEESQGFDIMNKIHEQKFEKMKSTQEQYLNTSNKVKQQMPKKGSIQENKLGNYHSKSPNKSPEKVDNYLFDHPIEQNHSNTSENNNNLTQETKKFIDAMSNNQNKTELSNISKIENPDAKNEFSIDNTEFLLKTELNKLKAENQYLKSNNKSLQSELDDSKFEVESLNHKINNINHEVNIVNSKLELIEKENDFLKKLQNDTRENEINNSKQKDSIDNLQTNSNQNPYRVNDNNSKIGISENDSQSRNEKENLSTINNSRMDSARNNLNFIKNKFEFESTAPKGLIDIRESKSFQDHFEFTNNTNLLTNNDTNLLRNDSYQMNRLNESKQNTLNSLNIDKSKSFSQQNNESNFKLNSIDKDSFQSYNNNQNDNYNDIKLSKFETEEMNVNDQYLQNGNDEYDWRKELDFSSLKLTANKLLEKN